MSNKKITILAIESSCDDTAAAVLQNELLLSHVIANQKVHEQYGGVVPELASRDHQKNIVPVVDNALNNSGIDKKNIDAIAFTRGPGLLGSLLVGSSFAKGFALARNIPLIEVNHLRAHILSHFIRKKEDTLYKTFPSFPFLCLTVSGGHTQIVIVKDYLDMEIIGKTLDDAAGEAFDKAAKILGLPYPGGPMIDQYAKQGNENAFSFSQPEVPNFDFSFSGIKTSFLYFIRKQQKINTNFIDENLYDICASLQKTIIDYLMYNLTKVVEKTGIKEIAIAGGVAANDGLRNALTDAQNTNKWMVYLPEKEYCTDNAAMIAIAAYFKYLKKDFTEQNIAALARMKF